MNRILLTTTIAFPVACLIGLSCSSDDSTGSFQGGVSSGGSSGSDSTGSSGSGTNSGGSSSTGSSGSDNTGTGGSGTGGSGTGGSGTGGSGTGGSGGAGTGGTGTGGTGGMAACETVDCVAGGKNKFQESLSSSYIFFPCYQAAGQDCITIPAGVQCPNQDQNLPFEQQGVTSSDDYPIGGVPGKMYALTIDVNGIAEAKYYMGGMRAAGNADPANADAINGTDTFYTGGTPVNFENYNIYKIVAKDQTGKEMQHYYLNSFPQTNTAYEHHQTFPIAFTHDIPVVGGGTITVYTADRNCHAIDNCGIGFRTTSCAQTEGRSIPNEPNFKFPATYMGKNVADLNLRGGASQPFHSQLFHITVTKVTAM